MYHVTKHFARQKLDRNGWAAIAAGFLLLGAAGCGQQYRPVVAAINPVGPAGQPTKYAVAISNPGAGLPGLLTVVDESGDTILSTPSILNSPTSFAMTTGGATGFVVNAAGAFDNFPLGNPNTLLTSSVNQTTLAAASDPVSISTFNLSGSAATIFVPETGPSRVAALQNNSGVSLVQELSVPANPVFVVGADSTQRAYIISQGTTGNGVVSSLEGTPLSISGAIAVGNTPVYGVMTPDDKRAFILNKGSGTVSVINVVNNALDSTTPVIPAAGTLGVNPVWADLSPRTASVSGTSELVVLNAGNGTTPGTLSIISIPLCNVTAQASNPNCNAANPADATGFGAVLATVTVGVNPVMVSILQDGSRAYVVNNGNAANGVEGSVSVVNLSTNSVTTIPAVSSATATAGANSTPTAVYGHPNTVATATGDPTGKVYITSSDNKFLTVIRTDTDSVLTHISLQGLGMQLPTAPTGGATLPIRPQAPGVLLTVP